MSILEYQKIVAVDDMPTAQTNVEEPTVSIAKNTQVAHLLETDGINRTHIMRRIVETLLWETAVHGYSLGALMDAIESISCSECVTDATRTLAESSKPIFITEDDESPCGDCGNCGTNHKGGLT